MRAPRLTCYALGAMLLLSALAAAFDLPFRSAVHSRRLKQKADDWHSDLRDIVTTIIGEWTTRYPQYDGHDAEDMTHEISKRLRESYTGFHWSTWIFATDTDQAHYGGGDEEHFGIATLDKCDRPVVRGCNDQGSMSQIDQETDHGKYSWVVMWTDAAKPVIADPEAALAVHKTAHTECADATVIFNVALSHHAKCIMDKTDAAGVLVFPVLADPKEDGGDFDKSELVMFQHDSIDVQYGHENNFNLRILPNSKWFTAAPSPPAPEVDPPEAAGPPEEAASPIAVPSSDLPTPLAGNGCKDHYKKGNCSFCIIKNDGKTPQCITCQPCFALDATKTSCIPSEDTCYNPQVLQVAPAPAPGYSGDGCTTMYNHKNCSLCVLDEKTYVPTCLSCEPCFSVDESGSNCVPSDENCYDFSELAPAPAPGPGTDIGEGCNWLYHEGQCSFCLLHPVTKDPTCKMCEPCFALSEDNNTCVPSEDTCFDLDDFAPAPAPGPDSDIGSGCDDLYNEGQCSFCLIEEGTDEPKCHMCEPCYALNDDNSTCVRDESTCLHFHFGPALAPALAPAPLYDDDVGEGCDPFYNGGNCSVCILLRSQATNKLEPQCIMCETCFKLSADKQSCDYTEDECPEFDLGPDEAPAWAPSPDYDDEGTDDWADAPGPDEALSPSSEDVDFFKPGEGCDKYYPNGCMYCIIRKHQPVCLACQNSYGMHDGSCEFSGAPSPGMELPPDGELPPPDDDGNSLAPYGDDEALPPFAEGPPLPQIPPGKGCTEQYQKGCRFCYYDFTKHLAVCDECMNNYGMTTEGFCKYIGRSGGLRLPGAPYEGPPVGGVTFAADNGPAAADDGSTTAAQGPAAAKKPSSEEGQPPSNNDSPALAASPVIKEAAAPPDGGIEVEPPAPMPPLIKLPSSGPTDDGHSD